MPHGIHQLRFAFLAALLCGVGGVAQEPPRPGKEKDAAVKLPDGTIVFYTKTPDDANPPIEGVRLSAKDYKALVEQADQLKKLKDVVKPVGPSECHVAARALTRGDRVVAELTLTYRFRTTLPRAMVALGGGRAFPTSAKIDGDALPVLIAADDGFNVLVETAGDHTLTLIAETPISARGFKSQLGFDIGLPKAAISSLTFISPYPGDSKGKRVTVSVRGGDPAAKPSDFRRTGHDATALAKEPVPLGAADLVEVTWDAASSTGNSTPTALIVESDVAVKIEDTQVETTAKVKLKGDAARDWGIVLPEGAQVSVERYIAVKASDPAAGSQPEITKPVEKSGPGRWTVELPDTADWVLTAIVRTPRDKGKTGTYPIGPIAVRNVLRQTGAVRISVPSNVRIVYSHGSELRRADPAAGESAAFQFHTVPVGPGDSYPPLLELTATPATGIVFLKPQYKFRLTPAGWRLHADLHFTPVRTSVVHARIEYPAEWPPVEFGPVELVENNATEQAGPRRATTIRFDVAKHDSFDLTMDVTLPVPPGLRTAAISFPQFPNMSVRESGISVAVPQGVEVRGSARFDADPAGLPTELLPPASETASKSAAVTLATTLPGAASRVDLTWQPFRPPLTADIQADVTVQDRQIVVAETIEFRGTEPIGNPLRLRGPVGVVGLRGQPTLTPAGPGEWTVTPPADRGRDFTLTLTFAVPARPDAIGHIPVGLIWSDDATHTEAAVRAWSGLDRRLGGFDGPWQESAPSASSNKDSLPGLTLKATRGPDDAAPGLSVGLADTDTAPARAIIERALIQVWFSADGPSAGRSRFVLSRWPAVGVDLDLPDTSVEVWLDGKRFDGLAPVAPSEGYTSAVRVPMPEPKPGRPAAVLDVRFACPKSTLHQTISAPHVRSAAAKTPPRWQVTSPPGTVALNPAGELTSEARWLWHNGRILPTPVGSTADLDHWILEGNEPTTTGEEETGIVGRQIEPGKLVHLVILPFAAWTAACSVFVLIVGLMLARMKGGIGFTIAIISFLAVVCYLVFPQPFGQFLAAAQPGLLAVAVVLLGQSMVRSYYRRRITNLPGFSRVPVESVADSGPKLARAETPAAAVGG